MRFVDELLRHKGNAVWFVSPDASVHHAARVMSERNVGAVLVCSGGELVGILSERDCLRRVLLHGLSAHDVLVGEVMSRSVVTVSPHDSVAHCMETMTNQRLRHLPVVEEGHVVGLVSIGDAVKAQISDQEQLISGLESYIHGTSAVAYPQAG